MKKGVFASIILVYVLSVPALASVGTKPSVVKKSECKAACRSEHKESVKDCIEFHDPRQITPSARGQCVKQFAQVLQDCLKACKHLPQ